MRPETTKPVNELVRALQWWEQTCLLDHHRGHLTDEELDARLNTGRGCADLDQLRRTLKNLYGYKLYGPALPKRETT